MLQGGPYHNHHRNHLTLHYLSPVSPWNNSATPSYGELVKDRSFPTGVIQGNHLPVNVSFLAGLLWNERGYSHYLNNFSYLHRYNSLPFILYLFALWRVLAILRWYSFLLFVIVFTWSLSPKEIWVRRVGSYCYAIWQHRGPLAYDPHYLVWGFPGKVSFPLIPCGCEFSHSLFFITMCLIT